MISTIVMTQLSTECQECKYIDECDEKKMILCNVVEHINKNPPMMTKLTAPLAMPMVQPILRERTPVTIKLGDIKIDADLEEIKRQLKEDFYKKLNCSFYKT